MLSNIGGQVKHGLEMAKEVLTAPTPTDHGKLLTTASGAPIGEAKNSMTAGPQGPVLMQDAVLYEKMSFFARERTPPRNVHALGFGAFGTFTVTHDITRFSKAEIFSKIGNSCNTFTRFSGVFTERGDADTIRDLRGFATKFYTTEGNWDMLAVNTPAFNVRDMKMGPDAIHAFKRDSRTAHWNGAQSWDFVATHPEGLQTQLMIWTDRVGTPKSFRMQHFFPCNTFSMINANNERHWVRFHLVSQQGWEGMTREQSSLIAGTDPNFLSREMHDAIQKGMCPKWKMFIQVMKEEEGYTNPIAFDCTKVWKHEDFPLVEIGQIEVNRLPNNYHTTTECVAFSPSRLIPGIGLSPDKLLQGRAILYDLAQDHRLGPNYLQTAINCPFASKTNTLWTFQGPHPGKEEFDKEVWPHYYPSLFGNVAVPNPSYNEPPMQTNGPANYYPAPKEYSDEDIYAQPREFLQVLSPEEMTNLIDNLGYSLSGVEEVVLKAISAHFVAINQTFANRVMAAVDAHRNVATPGRAMAQKLRAELNNPAFVIPQAM